MESIHAAHYSYGSGRGISQKATDYRTLPLCWRCHRQQHNVGEPVFWRGQEPLAYCVGYMVKYIGDIKVVFEALEAFIESRRKKK